MAQNDIKQERRAALEAACQAAGGVAPLAAKIGKKPHHVSTWKQRGMIPPEMAIPIEKATGISRTIIRPDLYPPEELPVADQACDDTHARHSADDTIAPQSVGESGAAQ